MKWMVQCQIFFMLERRIFNINFKFVNDVYFVLILNYVLLHVLAE